MIEKSLEFVLANIHRQVVVKVSEKNSILISGLDGSNLAMELLRAITT